MASRDKLQKLPSVSALLLNPGVSPLCDLHGTAIVTWAARKILHQAREGIKAGAAVPPAEQLAVDTAATVKALACPTLREVVNGTGVAIHTNLGRSPLGETVLKDLTPIILGYSNLEFDLSKGERGSRHDHVAALLQYLTGAEDAIAVNNNAAGLFLTLGALAKGREVIVSRGELIEIGGSFRLPEIMAASGAIMVDVGTTNKTRIKDYEKAVNGNTAMILKAHRSNFSLSGFTEEASLKELSDLAHSKGVHFVYDLGSGLLRRPANLSLESEPDVRSSLAQGAELVLFSGDKLLGGPQCGIAAGRSDLIGRLKKHPLMRAVRVGKLTIATLTSVMRSYLSDETLTRDNPVFTMLSQSQASLKRKAEKLCRAVSKAGVPCDVRQSIAQCGGGTLPDLKIESYSVRILFDEATTVSRSRASERMFSALLSLERPILGVLRSGELHFDVFTLKEADFSYIAESSAKVMTGKDTA
ncbi:MAG: L-seryl-tRNA(Sec) selenium transferase [Candidatus Wallbacteria bacterium]|nr:L-seryl-tRNA(Sec) selenium transferase [Candidatus Wallbacteria bacterium]